MARKRAQNFQRYNLFTAVMVLFAFLLVVRLVSLQIVPQEELAKVAKKQHQIVKPIEPERGKIYDRNGKILAFNVPCVNVVANADSVKDIHAVAARLSPIINVPYETIVRKLRKSHGWIELARGLPTTAREKIERADLSAVGCRDDLMRRYPLGRTAGQILGFTRTDGVGGYGLEMALESRLRGIPGTAIYQRTGRARLLQNPRFPIKEAQNGDDVVLTIDARYQRIAERELQRTVWHYDAKGGSVVILDPRSGDVLAMCSEPGFDPNEYNKFGDYAWKLAAVTDQFEPGSTFKPAVLSAMLDAGYKTESELVNCEQGRWHVMGETISDTKALGTLSVRDVLVHSSNIGMAKMAKDFDKNVLYDYAAKFGFGKKSGIELLGEISGTLKPPARWYPFSQLAFSYGHGVAVTPLQMCAMYATIANDGYYISPRIIKGIFRENERVHFDNMRSRRAVLSQETSLLMRDIMLDVVERGTGVNARIPGIEVCGKTGTAHVVSNGGYAANRYIASFGGFFPKDEPMIAIFVMINEPKGAYYGGTVAAPCFANITKAIINLEGADYFNAPPNQLLAEKKRTVMPRVVGLEKADATRILRFHDVEFRLFGSGDVILEQEPAAGDTLATDQVAYLKTSTRHAADDSIVVVPKLTELPLRHAINLLAEKRLGVDINGTGIVTGQRPSAGERVVRGTKVHLTCVSTI